MTSTGVADELELIAQAGRVQDEGRGIARADPAALASLGLQPGSVVQLSGARTSALVRLLPTFPADRGRNAVFLDPMALGNAGLAAGARARVRAVQVRLAERIGLVPCDALALDQGAFESLARRVDGIPVQVGDVLQLPQGGRVFRLKVVNTEPVGMVLIGSATELRKLAAEAQAGPDMSAGFASVGGLDREIQRLKEMIELPLKHPERFAALGIDPPRGVLLSGPPGSGKTLLARAVGAECRASFHSLSAPEVMQKFYGESEARLREVFDKAERTAPSIVFIDEIDAIAQRRDRVQGEVEKRVVAQLLTLMDGLKGRGNVVVIAATNLPNSLDPALRRPGRFDRELVLGVPDAAARERILAVHTRRMPLASDVRLQALAATTHGFTGADLRALCQEAGMCALRRDSAGGQSAAAGGQLAPSIAAADFTLALGAVAPSALRELAVEIPSTRFADIGGHETAKSVLTETLLWPTRYAELFRHRGIKPLRGVLLHGPPGTGKTMLARALASEAGVNFIAIRGPELLSRFVGESERAVREVFDAARMSAPCLLFFDELDALAPKRSQGGGNEVGDRVVAQLLTEIDGFQPMQGVQLLAATNRIDRVDPALLRPGRFDRELLIGLPSLQERQQILEVVLEGQLVADEVDLKSLAEATEGRSGAELRALIQLAGIYCLRRFGPERLMQEVVPLGQEDFSYALSQLRVSPVTAA